MEQYIIDYNYDCCTDREHHQIGTFHSISDAADAVIKLMEKTIDDAGYSKRLDLVDVKFYEPYSEDCGSTEWNIYWDPLYGDDYGYRVSFTIYKIEDFNHFMSDTKEDKPTTSIWKDKIFNGKLIISKTY